MRSNASDYFIDRRQLLYPGMANVQKIGIVCDACHVSFIGSQVAMMRDKK